MITADEVRTLYETRSDDYGPMWAAFDLDEKLYELSFLGELKLPKEFQNEGTVLPTARNTVDTFADYIGIDNVRVTVSRRKDTKEGNKAAEELRKFGQGIIYMTNVNSSISPWRVAAKHYPLYGVAWLKTVYNADLWPDKPEQKDGESDEEYAERISEWEGVCEGTLPISISAVNPNCIMFDKATMGQTWVIEFYEKPLNEIVRKYKKFKSDKYTEKQKVSYVDYWNKDYRCVLVEGQPVLNTKSGVVKHGYGFVPYVCIESGLGNVTADNDLSKRFVGINRYVKDVLKSQSRDYSIQDILIAKGGWPSGVLEGENAESQGTLDLSYGTYTPLKPGVTLKNIEPVLAPSEVTQHFYTTTEILDVHGIPRSLQGQSEQGVRSGSDRRQLMTAGASKFRYPEMAFKNRTASVLNNCARLLKVIPGNVTVWAHTPSDEFYDVIDKNQIREPINFKVEFPPVSEEDEYRRHDDYERMKQADIVTNKYIWKRMSDVSPEEMERDRLKERIRNSPSMAQAIDQLTGVLVNQLVQRTMAAEGIAPPVVSPPGGNGGPPTGGPQPPQGGMVTQNRTVPPPNSVEAIRKRMENTRSQIPINPNQGRRFNAGGSQNHPQRG